MYVCMYIYIYIIGVKTKRAACPLSKEMHAALYCCPCLGVLPGQCSLPFGILFRPLHRRPFVKLDKNDDRRARRSLEATLLGARRQYASHVPPLIHRTSKGPMRNLVCSWICPPGKLYIRYSKYFSCNE